MEEAEQLVGVDPDVLLVSLAEKLQQEGLDEETSEQVANELALPLLQEQQQPVLVQSGWDLLVLFAPYLSPSKPDSHAWRLFHHITNVCPPKEMVLAVLEQMQSLSFKKPVIVFMMLEALRNVLNRLPGSSSSVMDSTVWSVSSLLRPLLRTSRWQGRRERRRSRGRRERRGSEGESRVEGEEGSWVEGEGESKVEGEEESKVEGEEESKVEGEGESKVECEGENKVKGEEESRVEGEGKSRMNSEEGSRVEGEEESKVEDGETSGVEGEVDDESDQEILLSPESIVPFQDAAQQTLLFVKPFADEIHKFHVESNGGGWVWSSKQASCITLLLSLLDHPLVRRNLTRPAAAAAATASASTHSAGEIAQDIMDTLVNLHCGSFSLLARRQPRALPEDYSGTDTTPPVPLSEVGVACFAYLLLSEKLQISYLPKVYHTSFFFHVSVKHSKTLLEGQENSLIKKGLKLLETLLKQVPDHTLPVHLLDDKVYMELVEALVALMTLSQVKSIRETSVGLFQALILRFTASGRHRYYRSMLHHVTHAGVKGLIIHSVKNEVDEALKAGLGEGEKSSMFLNEGLAQLVDLILTVDKKSDLLKEFCSVMSALNFLRYLLIRDKKDLNQTGVWSGMKSLQADFTDPLRQLLSETQNYSRGELRSKREEFKSGKQKSRVQGAGQEPAVTVEVGHGGERLPEPSLREEINIIEMALQQMDMMESVLVRVEELMTV